LGINLPYTIENYEYFDFVNIGIFNKD